MDNFDLKKFLKESKAIENLNPSFRSLNENAKDYYKDAEADDAAHIRDLEDDMKDDKKASLKEKIKEMIVAELSADAVAAKDYDFLAEDELEEAKKKKDEDVEDVEDVEVTDTTEEVPAEDMPTDEEPAADGGGLEDIAADMKGTEADLMDNLMKAFQIAKGMGNEKLETQVGNTLKFFVSEYIGGGEG
jgi:hypothetical protein